MKLPGATGVRVVFVFIYMPVSMVTVFIGCYQTLQDHKYCAHVSYDHPTPALYV